MRHRLTTKLGVRWCRSPSGGWEIDGIPRGVLREFSRRRNEIEEALAELEEAIGRTSTIEELRNVVAETRPDKQHADPTDLHADWWRRAETHGFTPGDLDTCIGRAATPEPRPEQIVDLLDRLAAVDGITAEVSIFTRGDLLAALADAPVRDDHGDEQPLLLGAARLEELADAFLGSHRVVRLEPGEDRPRLRGLGDEPLYTTAEMLRTQQRARLGELVDGIRAVGGSGDARITYGDPTEELTRIAAEGYTLVLVGRHGRSWVADKLIGCTAAAVSEAVRCPVLVVPCAASS
jgi:nucleotide-binding universal stress UspA family protein